MDSHHKMHIAHPSFWVDSETGKNHPSPFTSISSDDVRNKKWTPRNDLSDKLEIHIDQTIFETSAREGGKFNVDKYCEEYTAKLEDGGRFQLCIWPEHCLIGTPGHCIVPNVLEAMDDWLEATGKSIQFVHKGQNLLTEMYSALRAEIPVDKSTSFSKTLMNDLLKSERILICGQAMSHCVNFTVRDILAHWPSERRSDLFLLVDCASPVPGFENAASSFVNDMKAAGVTVRSSTSIWGN